MKGVIRPGAYVAMCLELAMFGVSIGYAAWWNVVLWVLYFWFSATWAILSGRIASPVEYD